MFFEFQEMQFRRYREAYDFYKSSPESLIRIENFVMDEILHFIDLHLPEIRRDYNEASYLYSFWKNYPPLDRGRAPKGDQIPWLEVGEQVFGNKLSRYFANNFSIKDSGLPSGADDRCIIASERIRDILKITDSVWVFIDIKSAGPRDDTNHAVMSPYQISGSGEWTDAGDGIRNQPIAALGKHHAAHNFSCSLPPVYILSDGTIAPLATFTIKPVYDMLLQAGDNTGQPLKKLKIASIPNGILLTQNPNYVKLHPHLFFPGKDDKKKNEAKLRARVSFDILQKIDTWRIKEIAA